MSVSIFLSYRRDDDAGYAGRLYDRLSALFPGAVFMDVPGIAPGEDFAAKIEQAVRSSSVLLVLIGKQWITAIDKQGRRRLDDPDDFVRREILAALAAGIRVVPVIVPGAENLKAEELPEEISALARQQAVQLSHTHFDHDVDRIAKILGKDPDRPSPRRAWVGGIGALALIGVLALAGGFWLGWFGESPPIEVPKPVAQDNLVGTLAGSWDVSVGNGASAPAAAEKKAAEVEETKTARTTEEEMFGAITDMAKTLQGLSTVTASLSGSMRLDLNRPGNSYKISQATGSLQAIATNLGSSGTWTFDATARRLVLIPTTGQRAISFTMTEQSESGFLARDPTGVVYSFSRR